MLGSAKDKHDIVSDIEISMLKKKLTRRQLAVAHQRWTEAVRYNKEFVSIDNITFYNSLKLGVIKSILDYTL